MELRGAPPIITDDIHHRPQGPHLYRSSLDTKFFFHDRKVTLPTEGFFSFLFFSLSLSLFSFLFCNIAEPSIFRSDAN